MYVWIVELTDHCYPVDIWVCETRNAAIESVENSAKELDHQTLLWGDRDQEYLSASTAFYKWKIELAQVIKEKR